MTSVSPSILSHSGLSGIYEIISGHPSEMTVGRRALRHSDAVFLLRRRNNTK